MFVYLLILLGRGISAPLTRATAQSEPGTSSTRSTFYLQGHRRLVVRPRVRILNFMNRLLEGRATPSGLGPRHRASCRVAGLQYHQKVNKNLGPPSLGNGL